MTHRVLMVLSGVLCAGVVALAQAPRTPPPPPEPTGALAPANLAKARAKAPFDLTGVWLHGGGQNRYSWKNTCQTLADDGLHVIALDSRGHGDSDRAPDANYSVDALCTDTHSVLDQIGRPTILIGASMGGMTAMPVAHEAGPEKVTKLVA